MAIQWPCVQCGRAAPEATDPRRPGDRALRLCFACVDRVRVEVAINRTKVAANRRARARRR